MREACLFSLVGFRDAFHYCFSHEIKIAAFHAMLIIFIFEVFFSLLRDITHYIFHLHYFHSIELETERHYTLLSFIIFFTTERDYQREGQDELPSQEWQSRRGRRSFASLSSSSITRGGRETENRERHLCRLPLFHCFPTPHCHFRDRREMSYSLPGEIPGDV